MTQLILGILVQKFHYSDVQNRKCTKPARGIFRPRKPGYTNYEPNPDITSLIKTAN